MDQRKEKLRLTLEEIERLLAVAARTGAEVEPWVAQLAAELRAALPGPAQDGAALAGRMRSNPKDSLDAQSHLDPRALTVLKADLSTPDR
jgi:hypothetical protein